MTRREERDMLVTIIYELSFYKKDEYEAVYNNEKEIREIDSEYIDKGVFGVIEHLEEIDAMISENATGWKLTRMSRVTLAVMRVCVYEMIYNMLPYTIAINEAVELAKKYDDGKAPSFVNGILNKVAEKGSLKTNE